MGQVVILLDSSVQAADRRRQPAGREAREVVVEKVGGGSEAGADERKEEIAPYVVGRTPWSARVPLDPPVARRRYIPPDRPGGRPRTRGSAPPFRTQSAPPIAGSAEHSRPRQYPWFAKRGSGRTWRW